MKVMWITMAAIGNAAKLFYNQTVQSGGWIDATYNQLKPLIDDGKLSLDIVAIGNCNKSIRDEETNVGYHLIAIEKHRGKMGNASDKLKWKKLINEISPDIIMLWGSEFTYGIDIIESVDKHIPVCIYIQGVTKVLAQHPAGDIPLLKLYSHTGILSTPKFRAMLKEIKSNSNHSKFESELIRKADGVILDNEWTKAQFAEETNKFFYSPLAIGNDFYNKEWDFSQIERHSLFTVAGGASPIKGIHNVVYAVAKLKKLYPDIKLYIPGNVSSRTPHFLYDTIFIRHINKIIVKFGLESNIVFTGKLTPAEMANRMSRSNAFVMPSCVETHSSSLREAMLVGCPSITAVVGGVLEFAEHNKNAFLYRYDDIDSLVYYIDKIFSDDETAKALSKNSAYTIKSKFSREKIGPSLYDAYNQIIRGKQNEQNNEKN